MVSIFLILLVVALFVVLLLLTFFRNVIIFFLGSLFSIFRKGKKEAGKDAAAGKAASATNWASDSETGSGVRQRRRGKRISDSDGEYVDFEEVKK